MTGNLSGYPAHVEVIAHYSPALAAALIVLTIALSLWILARR